MPAVKKPKRAGVNIDMTPYVDVIMLILTFFMLTAQFKAELSEDIKINLPKSGNDTTKLPERNVMALIVTKDGDVFVDVDNMKVRQDVFGEAMGIGAYHIDSTTQPGFEKPEFVQNTSEIKRALIKYSNREQFKKLLIDLRLSSKSIVGKDLRIVVKGDKDADLGSVQDLMDILRETKNTRFSFVTDMDRGEPKQELNK
jgi:biopolymer transport protein ExbD